MSKELITNIDNLKDEEVNEVNKKSRLIVINSEGKILVAKYAGVYLLPGGKNEQEEDSVSPCVQISLGLSGVFPSALMKYNPLSLVIACPPPKSFNSSGFEM